MFAEHLAAGIQVVLVFDGARGHAIRGDVFFLEMQPGVVALTQRNHGGTVRLLLLGALMFRVVPESRRLEPCPCLVNDAGGHVERVPGHGARRATNHVAVGIIAKSRIG